MSRQIDLNAAMGEGLVYRVAEDDSAVPDIALTAGDPAATRAAFAAALQAAGPALATLVAP